MQRAASGKSRALPWVRAQSALTCGANMRILEQAWRHILDCDVPGVNSADRHRTAHTLFTGNKKGPMLDDPEPPTESWMWSTRGTTATLTASWHWSTAETSLKARNGGSTTWLDSACGETSRRRLFKAYLRALRRLTSQPQTWYPSKRVTGQSLATAGLLARGDATRIPCQSRTRRAEHRDKRVESDKPYNSQDGPG